MTTPRKLTKAELDAMGKEDLVAYVEAGGDLADVLAVAKPPMDRGPKPASLPDYRDLTMQLTSIRLPVRMVEELDRVAGRDKEGRSGVIRAAVDHYLGHLRESA